MHVYWVLELEEQKEEQRCNEGATEKRGPTLRCYPAVQITRGLLFQGCPPSGASQGGGSSRELDFWEPVKISNAPTATIKFHCDAI